MAHPVLPVGVQAPWSLAPEHFASSFSLHQQNEMSANVAVGNLLGSQHAFLLLTHAYLLLLMCQQLQVGS